MNDRVDGMQPTHTRRRIVAGLALGGAVAVGVAVGAAPAQAAPVGRVDAGVPFSSAVYGTGCTYSLTVPVNSGGRVTFWERKHGLAPHYIGAADAGGNIATVRWVPRFMGDRELYAVQNGSTSPIAVLQVHQGYGSGGLCFAL